MGVRKRFKMSSVFKGRKNLCVLKGIAPWSGRLQLLQVFGKSCLIAHYKAVARPEVLIGAKIVGGDRANSRPLCGIATRTGRAFNSAVGITAKELAILIKAVHELPI
jgi:hypothetical protein